MRLPTRFLLALLTLLLGTMSAQSVSAQAPANGPAAAADRAVRGWLERPPFDPLSLSGRPLEEVCRELPALVNNPAPPAGTRVNFANRLEREVSGEARRYTYPVTFPSERLAVLEVTLTREGGAGAWQVERVGVQGGAQSTIPAVLQNPAAGWVFAALSAGFLVLLVRPSFFRRWLAEGWGYLREHRRLVIGTFVLLYGLFGLGLLTGRSLPPVCGEAIIGLVQEGVEQLGAADAYESGNVARAATVTLYQNFVMGTLVTTYGVAFISFGVLGYVINGFRFLALGVPFGFTPADPLTILLIGILIVVELSAYVLVTAGGGMLLVTLVRKGFGNFRLALRKLTMMVPLALLLLVIGAWYEAAVLILPRLLGGP